MLKLQGPGIVPRGIVFDLTVEFGGTRRVAYAESGSKEDHDDTVRVLVPEMVDATSYEKSVQLFLIAYDLKGDVLGMANSSILIFRYESPKLSTVFVSFRGDFESIAVEIKGSNLGGPLGIARLCASSVPSYSLKLLSKKDISYPWVILTLTTARTAQFKISNM